jgi:hypothetical protein
MSMFLIIYAISAILLFTLLLVMYHQTEPYVTLWMVCISVIVSLIPFINTFGAIIMLLAMVWAYSKDVVLFKGTKYRGK